MDSKVLKPVIQSNDSSLPFDQNSSVKNYVLGNKTKCCRGG